MISKMKDASPADTIGEVAAGEIPLLLQWDERWGYSVYGDNMIAVNGCGPTAVAMVVSGLLCDPSVTPYKVAKFAEEQGILCGRVGNKLDAYVGRCSVVRNMGRRAWSKPVGSIFGIGKRLSDHM